jgi:hypothetical protein
VWFREWYNAPLDRQQPSMVFWADGGMTRVMHVYGAPECRLARMHAQQAQGRR